MCSGSVKALQADHGNPIRSLMLLFFLACQASHEESRPRVVVVVMDGVRAEESLGDRTSSATGLAPWEMMPQTWEKLVPQGARATSALNTGITITAPAHCALTSGLKQPLANYAVEDEPGIYRPELMPPWRCCAAATTRCPPSQAQYRASATEAPTATPAESLHAA